MVCAQCVKANPHSATAWNMCAVSPSGLALNCARFSLNFVLTLCCICRAVALEMSQGNIPEVCSAFSGNVVLILHFSWLLEPLASAKCACSTSSIVFLAAPGPVLHSLYFGSLHNCLVSQLVLLEQHSGHQVCSKLPYLDFLRKLLSLPCVLSSALNVRVPGESRRAGRSRQA
jgi:hypothetical protein